jgi:putative hydrolase of HD superfamily
MEKEQSKLIDLFFEIGTLMDMRRMHSQVLPLSNESIADHSFRVAIIATLLAERTKNINREKVIKMAIFHDVAEARTGDANFIHKFYNHQAEEMAYREQFADIEFGKVLISLLDEYNERKTKESLIAKDADLLDQMLLQQEYLYDRPKDLDRWQKHTAESLNTLLGKKLAKIIFKKNPLDWLYNFSEFKKGHK